MRKLLVLSGLLATAMMAQSASAQTVYLTTFYNTLGETRWEGISTSERIVPPSIVKPTFNFSEIKSSTADNVETPIPDAASSTFETDNLVAFVQEIEETNTSNDDTDLGDFVGTFVDIQSQSTGQSNQELVEDLLSSLDEGSSTELIDALNEVSNSSTVSTASLF